MMIFIDGSAQERLDVRMDDRLRTLTRPALVVAMGLALLAGCLGEGTDDDDAFEPTPSPPHAPMGPSISVSPADPRTNDDLVLSIDVPAFDADDDLAGQRTVWFLDGVEQPDRADTDRVAAVDTSRGQRWHVAVWAFDARGRESGPSVAQPVTILNTPPVAPSLFLAPTGAVGGQDPLVCEVVTEATDLDDDAITYTFSWTVDGVDYPAATPGLLGPQTTIHPGDTVPPQDSAPGQAWTCMAVASDGTADSEVASSTLSTTYDLVANFSLVDVNPTSGTYDQPVSPRDYLLKVSGWYFGHAT